MSSNAIELVDLHKSYGTFAAIRGLTLSVPKGSVFGFLGKNGTGINTQTTSSTRQGVHGSMFCTLGVPVSRASWVMSRVAAGYGGSFVMVIAAALTFYLTSPTVAVQIVRRREYR